ncbi:MAG: LytTR family DNA-binding domain-containing protein [Myxococcota bacterium]
MTLWSSPTASPSLGQYAWLLVIVPLGLGGIGASWPFALVALLVTAGVTPVMLWLHLRVLPRLAPPRTLGQRLALQAGAVLVGALLGSLPASGVWSLSYGIPFVAVYLSVLRITVVVTALVMVGLVAVDRASRPPAPPAVAEPAEVPRLTARDGGTLHVIDPTEVTRLYAADKYVALQIDGREVLLDDSLSALEARLGPAGFVRTHRGELVNRHHVRALEGSEIVLSDGQRARVSRRAAARVRRILHDS